MTPSSVRYICSHRHRQMPRFTAVGEGVYDLCPKTAWKVVSDWTYAWMTKDVSPAVVKDPQGTGVGATRTVVMLEGDASWTEEITKFEPENMTWSYKLTSELPPPFNAMEYSTFLCTLSVTSLGKNKCQISIKGEYDAKEAQAPLEPMYKGWADQIAKYASTVKKRWGPYRPGVPCTVM